MKNSMEYWMNNTDRKRLNTRGKPCLTDTNLTRTDLRMNPGLRGEKPATNRLSNGSLKSV